MNTAIAVVILIYAGIHLSFLQEEVTRMFFEFYFLVYMSYACIHTHIYLVAANRYQVLQSLKLYDHLLHFGPICAWCACDLFSLY